MKKQNTRNKFEMVERLITSHDWVLNLSTYLEKLKNEALMVNDYVLAADIRKKQLEIGKK
jgi:hypothetical protein